MLHPTIPVHAPLIFDIIDRWQNEARSIARCTYYVGSPDGRLYTGRPLNETEAAERRQQRFQKSEPPPGAIAVPAQEGNPTFPTTLDLRFPPPTSPSEDNHFEKTGLIS
jgi:uncharacterized protein (DUF2126 family)